MAKILMKGCEAIGEAAVRAGCRHFFGYPITPQTEVPEYLVKRFAEKEIDGVFVQAESEVAASNMIYGAAGVGVRVLTTSSSPGVSLMAEGISYIAACELPVVLVNIVRAGPGLGGILPAQSDYFQATKGGGHGDYRLIVLAPSSVQEAVDLVVLAFDLADEYRNPVMVMGDGMIGQMMEPVELPPMRDPTDRPEQGWALTGARDRPPRIVNSLYLNEHECNALNERLRDKYLEVRRKERRFEPYACDEELELLVVAYGTMARICRTAIDEIREEGRKVGMFRPISLYPYPYPELRETTQVGVGRILTVEMSMGQMVEDVELAIQGAIPIDFYGLAGGLVPSPDDVLEQMRKLLGRA